MDVPTWVWLGFGGLVLLLLAVDIVAHLGAREISRRSAAAWSAFWVGVGLAFGVFVGVVFGADAAHQYVGAWAMEKSLSLDNLFLFLLVFSTLRIDPPRQRYALYLGIAGALVFRGIFIWLGLEVLAHFAWVEWIFGGILLVAAVHAAREHPDEQEDSKVAAWLARHLPVASKQDGTKLFTRENGRRVVTPMLVAIMAIELADIAFAIDSVPAALAVTKEPFLVYSSNVFAILGLRSLYALLASTISGLKYLHWGVAAVLAFASVKIVGHRWFHVPALLSVIIIAACIGTAIVASVIAMRRERARAGEEGPPSRPAPATSR